MNMPVDVEGSTGGEGLALRDSRLHVWMRRGAVIAAHVTGLSLTITISVLSRPGTSLFSWHPLCMSVAYWLCMAEGLLLVSAEGNLCCCNSLKRRERVHWFLESVGLVTAIVGVAFMVASKDRSELPHLVSWHSILGLCTVAITLLQAACGVCILFPQLFFWKRLQPPPHPSKLKLYHNTCGLMVYVLATFTVVSAMFSDWLQASVTGVFWWLMFVLSILSALVVINQILNAHLPHKKITN